LLVKHFKFSSLLFVIVILVLTSCSKEKEDADPKKESHNEPTEEESDTNMTAEEIFSSNLVQEISGTDDIDLQLFIEDQFYPSVSKSSKVTLDRVSSSLYLLSYDDNGTTKNFLIQKFYNPVNDEFVFDKTETQSNAMKQFLK